MEDITVSDMADFFREFIISNELYDKWKLYAENNGLSMKNALVDLLRRCPPGTYYDPDDIHIRTKKLLSTEKKTFPLHYSPVLKREIFAIFKQTGYKNNSEEMNYEIIERISHMLHIYFKRPGDK